jgi:hypothetical protein
MARRAPGGPTHLSGGYQPIVPRGFDTHCSSVPSVDGSSRRELFEFEHRRGGLGGVGGSNLLI